MEVNEELKGLKNKIDNHEQRISKLESLSQKNPEVTKKRTSIKEFILSKEPKNDIQKTLVIGYYLENYKNFQFFNAKDLKESLRRTKEKIPKNINRNVIKNVERGYMEEYKEKKDKLKAWSLTSLGEKFVENNFEDGRRKNN